MPRGATESFDGLVVGYGTHTVDNEVSGVIASGGGRVTIQQEFILADLVDTATATTAPPQSFVIPRGSIALSATLVTLVAATSGGSATLDIGAWSRGLAAEIVDDADGFVEDVTIAEMTTIGEVHVCDGAFLPLASGTTNILGATANGDVVISPSYETAVFTAGVILFTVELLVPFGSADRVIAV